VSDDYKERDNKFTGKIHKVTIDIARRKLGAAEQKTARPRRGRRRPGAGLTAEKHYGVPAALKGK
jgi:hypothetical protein